jgi:hypothetical protein
VVVVGAAIVGAIAVDVAVDVVADASAAVGVVAAAMTQVKMTVAAFRGRGGGGMVDST